ncbi:MAG: VWA domain-containing protein [Alphaproteobacteria bacterium]|nr:VWA domain-containing protein [Alphaproteobacteria bacterium]
MKKKIVAWLTLIFVLITSVSMMIPSVAAENVNSVRKFNVVFVVDASNSMNATDSQGWRFEAIDQFLSLLSLKGNYVGTVVFNGEILTADGVTAINSKSDKQTSSNAVKNVTPVGYTNIGEALVKANELIKNGDASLPSIILLLSDGNTEMPSNADLQRSLSAQDNAISTAKNNDTQIYCVGLNANGKVDPSELSNIATQTNGVFKIVSKADDLKDVFKEFYKLIYGTGGAEIENVALPAVKEFVVPKIGVEEVNILIDGQPSSIKLTQPSGMTVSNDELNSMISKGKHFTNIKIEKPLSGTWKLELNGQPGQTVTINFIPNLNVSLITEDNDVESYKRGENVPFVTKIVSEGVEVTDNSIYQEYPATLTITNANDSSDTRSISAVALEGKYKADTTFDKTGTYYVTASIDIGYGQITGNTTTVSVGNFVPKPTHDLFKATEYCMNFGKTQYSYDLNELVKDEDGEKLSFVIDKAYFDSDEYVIEDGILKITPKAEKEGSFSIIATDEQGASCELQINIVYKNLLKFLIMLITIILCIAVILFLIIKHIVTHKAFNGSVTVVAFDEDNGDISAPMTEWPAKKPIDIAMINGESDSIGGIRGSFYGSGKNYVNLSLKGTAYYNGRKVKKVKIFDGCTDRVTSREDGMKGVEITYTKQDGEF